MNAAQATTLMNSSLLLYFETSLIAVKGFTFPYRIFPPSPFGHVPSKHSRNTLFNPLIMAEFLVEKSGLFAEYPVSSFLH
jgi:hypothetical protein